MGKEAKYKFNKNHDVRIIKSQIAYSGIFSVEQIYVQFKLFSGKWSKVFYREIFHRGHGVGVLLYNPWKDILIFVQQFRVGALKGRSDPWLFEIPAGVIDLNETKKQAIKREILEETGIYKITQLEPICDYWVTPGGSSEYMSLYCGCVDIGDLEKFSGIQQEGEDIYVKSFKVNETFCALNKGKIKNSHTIIALQWLQLNLSKIKQKWLK